MEVPCKRQRSQAASSSSGVPATFKHATLQPVVGQDEDRAYADGNWDDIFDEDAELDRLQREAATTIISDDGGETPKAEEDTAMPEAICDVSMCSKGLVVGRLDEL